jgi:hypothetical protein
LKDKWQQRGFTGLSYRGTTITQNDSKPGRPFDVATKHEKGFWYLFGTSWSWSGNNDITLDYYAIPTNLNTNFYYDTQIGSNVKTSAAYVQEWARVSNWTDKYVTGEIEIKDNDCDAHDLCRKEIRGFYWAKSLDEKETHVKETLTAAVDDKEHKYIWINSLCGYFIDTTIEDSYYPCAMTDYNANANPTKRLSSGTATSGLKGNIASFAEHMNEMFNNYLKSETNGYVPGSMGIIMMDRVGDDENSKNIPSYIVSNNFKHDTGTQAATLSEIKKAETPFDPNNETPLAKPRNSEGGMTITWE